MSRPQKQKRAPRGTGSVFFSKSRGLWIARRPVGRRNGRTVYLTRTGATQAAAIAARDRALPPDPDRTTVAAWAEQWLAGAEVREQTRDLYRESVELRINPQLGDRLLAAVTPYDVERAAAAWGKEVSANSVRKHLGHLRSLFSAALRARLVPSNPVSVARKPRATKVEIDCFTAEELAQVVAAASREPRWHRLAVMAAIGCRIGEAIALKQSDYNGATGVLSISRNRTKRYGVGPTKSANSLRSVRVPSAARRAAAALGPELDPSVAWRRWKRLLASLGLRERGPHQARHSCASLALAAGVPIANVSRDLGDSVATIVKTYLHATEGQDVCGAMEGLLQVAKVPKECRREGPKAGKRPENKPRGRAAS